MADCDLDQLLTDACTNQFLCLEPGSQTTQAVKNQLLCNLIAAIAAGGGTPGGSDTQVQFNDGGSFGGDADFTWNKTTNLLSITGGESITAEANETPFSIASYSLTGANAQSMLSLAGTWNTSGTPTAIDLDITDTASNGSSRLFNFSLGGSPRLSLFKSGRLDIGGGALVSGLRFTGSGQITPVANGRIRLSNDSATDFDRLQFGGTSSAFPSLKRSATILQARLADDSAFTEIECSNIITNNAGAAFSTNTTLTDNAGAGAGTLANAPTAGNPTKWCAFDDNGTTRYFPTWT